MYLDHQLAQTQTAPSQQISDFVKMAKETERQEWLVVSVRSAETEERNCEWEVSPDTAPRSTLPRRSA